MIFFKGVTFFLTEHLNNAAGNSWLSLYKVYSIYENA
jgi:hypothetical protein